MTDIPQDAYSRRLFLQQGVTLASMMATVPFFVERSAHAMMRPIGSMTSSQAGVPEDRVLVVVQLGGGNDGLNTVVPYGNDEYYRRRPSLGIKAPGQEGGALRIDGVDGVGLHPNMTGLKELMDDGVASIVQGVGYPNPNRSHFASMDIWHTAETSGKGFGWIGKYFDNTCNGTPEPQAGMAIGNQVPLAMNGSIQSPISFESADAFRWAGQDLHSSLREPYDNITREGRTPGTAGGSQMDFLMRTSLDAQLASDRIRAAVAKQTLVQYPGNRLAQQLKIVSAMIRDEMPTRVYYVSLGGFDTHANQSFQHASLMTQLSQSLNAFYKDMKAQGNSKRVLTMVFSEFGRRVSQNASGGTDHGTAAPMYFVGDMLRPGLLGQHPSLRDLDNGDLKFQVDFRSVYTSVLQDWMKSPANEILGQQYKKANLIQI